MVDSVSESGNNPVRDDEDASAREAENIEMELLLEAVYRRYGYDFRNYSRASLYRRIQRRKQRSDYASVSQLTHEILYSRETFASLLADLTINVTEMYRDPDFYLAFREQVVPLLKTYPFIKIWHAGCATGEEIYSMAILLMEEGLYQRSTIYATDIDKNVLAKAKKGIYDIDNLKQYSSNYQKAGGKESLASYYTAGYNGVIMNPELKKNIVFADHDLVTDQVFGEMQVVVCRNVLIYFDKALQNRAIGLFHESLDIGGVLCMGSKESLRFTEYENKFSSLVASQKIFQRQGGMQ